MILHEKLHRMREDAQSAAFALAVANQSERGAIVALGDAVVEVA